MSSDKTLNALLADPDPVARAIAADWLADQPETLAIVALLAALPLPEVERVSIIEAAWVVVLSRHHVSAWPVQGGPVYSRAVCPDTGWTTRPDFVVPVPTPAPAALEAAVLACLRGLAELNRA